MSITHAYLAYFKYYYFIAQLVNSGQSCNRNVRNTASYRKSSDKVKVKMNVRDWKMKPVTWTTITTMITATKPACLLILLILFLYRFVLCFLLLLFFCNCLFVCRFSFFNRLCIKTCADIIPLQGATWSFGIFSAFHKVFAYIFTTFSSTQVNHHYVLLDTTSELIK